MSKKDAFWFSHDSNAKDDPKITYLIDQLALEGYGIFWVLIETLRDQPNYKYPLNLLPSLARKYATTTAKMQAVVKNYGLFEIENNQFFYSNSLCERMLKHDEVKELKRIAGVKSGEARRQKVLQKNEQMLNTCSTDVEQMVNYKRRGEERRGEDNNNLNIINHNSSNSDSEQSEQLEIPKPKKLKEKKPSSIPSGAIELVKQWANAENKVYEYSAKEAGSLNTVFKRITALCVLNGIETTEKVLNESFVKILANLSRVEPWVYGNFSISLLASKFDVIATRLKNNTDAGKTSQTHHSGQNFDQKPTRKEQRDADYQKMQDDLKQMIFENAKNAANG